MITRQDIIDMANEAQLDDCIWIDEPDSKHIDDLVKFSELVQAKERSHWKEIVEGQRNCLRALNDIIGGEGSATTDNILAYSRWEERVRDAVQQEREKFQKQLAVLHDQYSLMSPWLHK